MRTEFLKIFLCTLAISVGISVIPWFMYVIDLVPMLRVIERYAVPCSIIGLTAAFAYGFGRVSNIRQRVFMVLFNPVFYYLIFMLIVIGAFIAEAFE